MTLVLCLVSPCRAGLLGAGQGDGSCAAPPFRAERGALAWPDGCPGWAPCCTEYGYCHSQVTLRPTCHLTDLSLSRKVGRTNSSVTVTERVTASSCLQTLSRQRQKRQGILSSHQRRSWRTSRMWWSWTRWRSSRIWRKKRRMLSLLTRRRRCQVEPLPSLS